MKLSSSLFDKSEFESENQHIKDLLAGKHDNEEEEEDSQENPVV